MVKHVRRLVMLVLVAIVVGVATALYIQPTVSQQSPPRIATPDTTQQSLANAVLREAGIPRRYDLYLGNAIDMALVAPRPQEKLAAWLQSLLRREAGWRHVEAMYVSRLVADFSEAELTELLAIVKQPIVRKLFEAEVKGYTSAGETRRKLFFEFWDGYNSGRFPVPDHVLR